VGGAKSVLGDHPESELDRNESPVSANPQTRDTRIGVLSVLKADAPLPTRERRKEHKGGGGYTLFRR